VVVAHGTLDDPERYTHTVPDAIEQMARLGAAWPQSRILLLGHTHRPLAVVGDVGARPAGTVALGPANRVVLNPGAVGQAREFRALSRALLLDLDAGEASFLRIPYDTAACRAALRRAGLPPGSCHLPPSPRRRMARVTGGAYRRLRARGRGAAG
jgi:diadenosine tetraphosphatase ApaH/serine/threonine PP2A family protein phosphatase